MLARHQHPAVGRLIAVRRTGFFLLSGLFLAAPINAPARAQTGPVALSPAVDPYAGHIAAAARRFGIPEAWIRAVMRVESRGDMRAISKAGAIGLMQIMPATWADMRARYGLGNDPFDPHDNIMAGAAFLRDMYDRFGSPGFLAAYNAGPGRYEEYRATGRALPFETRAYVAQLGPLVSGETAPAVVSIAAADPLAWTRAPLFTGTAEGDPGAGSLRKDAQSGDRDAVAPPRNSAADTNPTGGLFVSRRDPAGPR